MKENNIKLQLLTFFGLTFLFTWIIDLLKIFQIQEYSLDLSNEAYFNAIVDIFLSNESVGNYNFVLILGFIFVPTIVAFLTTGIFSKVKGIRALWQRIFENIFSWKWYGIAILIHLFLIGSSMAFGLLTGGFQDFEYNSLVSPSTWIFYLLYLIVFTGVSEEIGWRGFALPKLQKIYDPYKSSIILGIIWGLWHLPLTVYAYRDNLSLLPFTLLGLIAGTAGWSVVVTWFYNNSKSLFAVFFLHGFGNFILSVTILSSNLYLANVFYGFAPWILVYFLEKKFGKNFLETKE